MTAPRLLAAVPAALALVCAAAPAALADTLVSGDASAANVTVYGNAAMWTYQDASSNWHLAMSTDGGPPVSLAVGSSTVPFDPDLGPTASGGKMAVYARCTGGTPVGGCDVYRYDLATATERRVRAISKAATSEYAPSYFQGAIAFARGAGGSRKGTYLYRPGRPLTRLDREPAAETDLSEIVVAYNLSSGDDGGTTQIRTSDYRGRARRLLASTNVAGSGDGSILASPVVQRYWVYWLERVPLNETATVRRSGLRSRRGTVQAGSPVLAGDVGSIGTFKLPVWFTRSFGGAGGGVFATDPLLVFS